jgi:hypothetical protein
MTFWNCHTVQVNSAALHMDQSDRGLQSQACKDECRNQAMPCRSITGCSGRRRRELQAGDNLMYATCSDQVAEMHARLDAAIATNTLSTNCKLLLARNNRNTTCQDGIVSSEIGKFTLRIWTESTGAYTSVSVTGNEITVGASGVPVSLDIAVQLIPCVRNFGISIVGRSYSTSSSYGWMSGSIEQVYMFAGVTNNVTYSGVKRIPPGTYNVTAIPNKNSQKAKSFTMIVKA